MNIFKKIIRFILFSLFLIIVSLSLFILVSASPSIKENSFASNRILTFHDFLIEPSSKTPEQIKLVTYNIGYASGLKNNQGNVLSKSEILDNLATLSKTLQNLNADIIALQEVDFNSSRSYNINQVEFIAKKLHMPHAAYVVTWNKRYVPWPYFPISKQFGKMLSGQAVLSRYPILDQKLLRFKKPNENQFWYNWFYLNRIAQNLQIQIGQKTFSVWNIHLEAYKEKTRLEQAEILSEDILKDNLDKLIVMGDFNSISHIDEHEKESNLEETKAALQEIIWKTGLTNTEVPLAGDNNNKIWPLSFPSHHPVKKIDHILIKAPLEVMTSGSIKNVTASDHLAIWAEIKL